MPLGLFNAVRVGAENINMRTPLLLYNGFLARSEYPQVVKWNLESSAMMSLVSESVLELVFNIINHSSHQVSEVLLWQLIL